MNFKRFGRTANLFDGTLLKGFYGSAYFNLNAPDSSTYRSIKIFLSSGTYTISFEHNVNIVRQILDGVYTEDMVEGVNSYTFTATTDAYYGISFRLSQSSSTPWDNSNIMFNTGSTALPYQPYKDWTDIPYYIMGTDTDTITPPATIYPDITLLDVDIDGNEQHTGTPSPQNPVDINGVGERTAQLWDKGVPVYVYANDYKKYNPDNAVYIQAGTYTISTDGRLPAIQAFNANHTQYSITDAMTFSDEYYPIWDGMSIGPRSATARTGTITILADCIITFTVIDNQGTYIMLNTGSEPLPYEPYGYKIPITCAGTTYNKYLGVEQTTRLIKKLVLDGTENWFDNWRPKSGTYGTILPSSENKIADMILCTHLSQKSYDNVYHGTVGISTVEGNSYLCAIRVPDTIASSSAEFKQWLVSEYSNGTPVCVWYVLNSATTGITNEPLMKIGSYADRLKATAIPTNGTTDVTVDTTIQPSNVSVNGYQNVAMTLKGNTVQSGTPAPSNPVSVDGCGERTENLTQNDNINSTSYTWAIYSSPIEDAIKNIDIDTDYVLKWDYSSNGSGGYVNRISLYDGSSNVKLISNGVPFSVTQQEKDAWINGSNCGLICYFGNGNTDGSMTNFMLTKGQTAPTIYIPYGYKIPILSNSTTYNKYLGEEQTVRNIVKVVFKGDETETWVKSNTYQGSFYTTLTADYISASYDAYCSHAVFASSASEYSTDRFMFTTGANKNCNLWIGEASWSVANFKAYLQQQYANGTPVTVWYVLATEQTAVVNEPLMKIGNYADSLSTSIPTVDGANSLSVDTTIQPSEVTAAFHGWHPVSTVHERDNDQWD